MGEAKEMHHVESKRQVSLWYHMWRPWYMVGAVGASST